MRKIKLIFKIILTTINSIGQTPDNIPLRVQITKRIIPYEYVREADVVWSKRLWQSIDLTHLVNLCLKNH